MGLNIKKANSVEEWKQDNLQAFDPTNDKSNKDNHGIKFPENRLHNPNNWDPKNYEEKYPDRPMGVSGISANSEFERTMDDDTKKMLWGVINENTQLQQENYYLRVKLSQIQTILDEYKAYSAK